jgi:D-glycero-alpha-D-manno-heptose-7-phosphate kinase
MLIVRAPVRISFGGGGTDLETYYAHHGGLVLSAAISRYCYAILTPGDPEEIQISSADMRLFNNRRASPPGDVEGAIESPGEQNEVLQLPWAVLRRFGVRRGLNIFLASEVPPGTGLGSSSAMAVALVKAMAALGEEPFSRAQIAEIACGIEIGDLGAPIGRQDQYASAFGGLNTIRFPARPAGGVVVEPLPLARECTQQLERHLLLFFTGTARNSASILRAQQDATAGGQAAVLAALDALKALALEMRACLLQGALDRFGALLDTSWQYKKQLTGGITTPAIDAAYTAARAAGAWGGKITGAGGGGFLLVCCPPERQGAVSLALQDRGLHRMGFRFDRKGASVLLNSGDVEVAEPDYADMLRSLQGATWGASEPIEGAGGHTPPVAPVYH